MVFWGLTVRIYKGKNGLSWSVKAFQQQYNQSIATLHSPRPQTSRNQRCTPADLYAHRSVLSGIFPRSDCSDQGNNLLDLQLTKSVTVNPTSFQKRDIKKVFILTLLSASPASPLPKQIMSIQQSIGNLRPFLQPTAYRGLDGLAGFAAQAGQMVDVHGDAAHAAYFIAAGGDLQADAELLVHALLQTFEVAQAIDIFQPFEQELFFGAGQAQEAQIGVWVVQQAFAPADAGAGRAGLAILE
jgi:hypothetical protein